MTHREVSLDADVLADFAEIFESTRNAIDMWRPVGAVQHDTTSEEESCNN